MKNAIAKDSYLYEELLRAYDVEDSLMRFNTCYEIIDQADYVDILFVISRLKELDCSAEIGGVLSESFQAVFLAIKHLFGSKSIRRCNYLLDLLEEAKERKRPA